MATSLQQFLNTGGAKIGVGAIGANSVQFSKGDAIIINTSGFLDLASTSGKQLGWSLEDKTMTSDNQTVAKYMPLWCEAGTVQVVLTASAALTQTQVGEFSNYSTAASGNFVVNATTSATSGTVYITAIDPFGIGDNTQVAVEVANPGNLSYTGA